MKAVQVKICETIYYKIEDIVEYVKTETPKEKRPTSINVGRLNYYLHLNFA